MFLKIGAVPVSPMLDSILNETEVNAVNLLISVNMIYQGGPLLDICDQRYFTVLFMYLL